MAHGVFKPRNKQMLNDEYGSTDERRVDPKRTRSTRHRGEFDRRDVNRFGPEGDMTQWRHTHRNRD